ncbi:hypothetical protein J2S74_004534 [Evansella vedderi]|uniref:Uncharacterized protein n=1 Tax=Evansella vedderi TaxID=38282 RepID=A0ABU0A0S0_9BACI|nr:hypothetical protein [Evansella vedderi]MDQ0257088.1 hypothetical protein [Evansella vedderi]
MIDTFEIALLTGYSAINLLETELEEDIRFKGNFCKIIDPLGKPGVRAINITRLKNSKKYRIAIEINPTELIGEVASIELFDCSQENLESLEKALNATLEYIHPELALTNEKWKLSRIDFALQFYTSHVELYTILESKGPIPYRFKGLQMSGSTYNKCKSSRINAYSKQDQMSKTNCPVNLKEKAKDLYRFEYQCLNTDYLLKKYNIEKSNLFGLFREDIAQAVLKRQHGRHIKTGDYYTYNEAVKLVMKMKKQERSKQTVIEVLKFIEVSGSFPNALQAIETGAESVPDPFRDANSQCSYNTLKEKFNEFVREHLCKAGINPILLPVESNILFLPNTSTKLFIA